jgi:hypothetical protein
VAHKYKKGTAIMNKSLLSQLLDGAAFPAIMLAVAVSQINGGPNRKDMLRQGGRVPGEMGDGVQEDAKESPFYSPRWSPPIAEKSVVKKKPAQAD